jgi:ATP-binding cassette subfamily C protein
VPVASRAHVILLESQLNSFQENNLADPGRTAGLALGPIGVEFQDVSFQYENSSTFAIKNVAFTIKAGQQVAFLGPSGAGKSTIADLMCGVARPALGQVLLDIGGEDIPNNHSYSVSYVPQKPGIVSGSVSQNVALGSDPENINEREVLEAITRANLEPVISSLPLGIHTDLGNFHDALSGGQIQRLGLARALYSKPGLLVMDEATSALDAESEAEIAKALEKMRGKVTVVLIAHRLNTVHHADQVFLIEEGRIVDQGTFQELIRRNPSIVRLVQLMKVDED